MRRSRSGLVCQMVLVLLAALVRCGPYSYFSREAVAIDIEAGTLTQRFEGLRPMYVDSVDKAWEEIVGFLDDVGGVDTLAGLVFEVSAGLELSEGARLDLVVERKLVGDTGSDTSVVRLDWRLVRDIFGEGVVDNEEVILHPEPSFFDCTADSCRFVSDLKAIRTAANLLVVFPEQQTSIAYAFEYSFPAVTATYREHYNAARVKRGWDAVWK